MYSYSSEQNLVLGMAAVATVHQLRYYQPFYQQQFLLPENIEIGSKNYFKKTN
jgi:hypothetical protein